MLCMLRVLRVLWMLWMLNQSMRLVHASMSLTNKTPQVQDTTWFVSAVVLHLCPGGLE